MSASFTAFSRIMRSFSAAVPVVAIDLRFGRACSGHGEVSATRSASRRGTSSSWLSASAVSSSSSSPSSSSAAWEVPPSAAAAALASASRKSASSRSWRLTSRRASLALYSLSYLWGSLLPHLGQLFRSGGVRGTFCSCTTRRPSLTVHVDSSARTGSQRSSSKTTSALSSTLRCVLLMTTRAAFASDGANGKPTKVISMSSCVWVHE
mmetsp:Transcript_37477/g.87095  ORF Transcript_37477/g.87095 Transcript_37477/m.87095 type:complete len:208 (+) Transcript_37477:165-788(+)